MKTRFRSSRDVIIRTADWSKATAFYRDVLGLAVTHTGDRLIGFETGAFRLFVEKGKPHGPVFEFFVPDVEAAKTGLLAAGCTLEEELPSIPRCYIRDPYGFVFNLARAE
jgi:catechol 2,3-dioxygenase-like lactoylglutathione lyase family enzyme